MDEQVNVLFIVWDATRAHNTSIHGYRRNTTPHLEELINTEAVFYKQAYAPSSWSLPSHASLFTGEYPSEHGTHSKNIEFRKQDRHIANILGDNGYKTGVFTDNPYVCAPEFGLSEAFDYNSANNLKGIDPDTFVKKQGRGEFIEYLKQSMENDYTVRSLYRGVLHKLTGGISKSKSGEDSGATRQIDEFLEWHNNLERRDGKQPFFAFLNLLETHDPYNCPHKFQKEYVSKDKGVSTDHWEYYSGEAPMADLSVLEDKYDGCIKYLDGMVNDLLQELDKREILEDTIVIITSDHGEGFGEPAEAQDCHSIGHQVGISEELVHVPLVIRYPDGEYGGKTVEESVSIKEIYNTILKYAGCSSESDGNSLRPDTDFPDPVLSMRMGLSQSAYALAQDHDVGKHMLQTCDSRIAACYVEEGESSLIKYTRNFDSDQQELHKIRGLELKEIQRTDIGTNVETILESFDIEDSGDQSKQIDISGDTRERLEDLGYM